MARDLAPLLALAGILLFMWGLHDDRTASFDNGTFMWEIIKMAGGIGFMLVAIVWAGLELFK